VLAVCAYYKIMKKITVKIGDKVKLYNGTEGIISEIDKSVYQFLLAEQYIIWFHFRDVQILNGEEIDNDLLSF
jgi:hypothetical protein